MAASLLISRPIFLRIHNSIVNNNSPKAADPSIPGSSSPSLLLICALICEGLELKISSIGQKPLYGPQIESGCEKKFHRQEFQMDFFYVESLLKQVYVFFMNKGHKRMSFLREAMGGEKITFGGNYETRWAASEKKQSKS